MNLEERVELLEFQMEMLHGDPLLERLVYEAKLTGGDYEAVLKLLGEYREKIGRGETVSRAEFEEDFYKAVPSKDGDYGFCECLLKTLAEAKRFEDVFQALYANVPKYSGKLPDMR